MNFLPVESRATSGQETTLDLLGTGEISVRTRGRLEAHTHGPLELGIRPEHIDLQAEDDPSSNLSGRVHIVERLGNSTIVYVDTSAGTIVVEEDGEVDVSPGDNVGVLFNPSRAHVFAADAQAV